MKRLIPIFFCLGLIGTMYAQPDPERLKEIETVKIAYITKEVNLTPKQAEKFWPVYNEYSAKRKEVRQQLRKLKRKRKEGMETATDDELKRDLDKFFDLKKQELQLDITYRDKMQTILNVRQLMKLYQAEKEFLIRLRETVHRKRGKHSGLD